MPPDLVAAIRRYSADATFPPPPALAPESPLTPPPADSVAASKNPGQPALEGGLRADLPELQEPEYEPKVEFLFDSDPLASAPRAGAPGEPVDGRSAGAGLGTGKSEDDRQEDDCGLEADLMCWFLTMLQEAMTGVMAGDIPPLQKANAIARLGNLYLKACRVKELEQANKALQRRVAELEQRAAAAEARTEERGAMIAASAQWEKEMDRCSPALPGAGGRSEVDGEPAPPGVRSARLISAAISPPSSRGSEASESIPTAPAEHAGALLIGSAAGRAPP